MVKVSMSGDGDLLLLSDILDGCKLKMEQFRKMCIVAGCDYLKSIKGIGIRRAFQLVSSDQDLMELLSQRGESEDYMGKLGQVEEVFKHQTVFDLQTCTTVPLLNNQTALSMDVQLLCVKYPYL